MKGLAFLCLGESMATDFGTSLIASQISVLYSVIQVHFQDRKCVYLSFMLDSSHLYFEIFSCCKLLVH